MCMHILSIFRHFTTLCYTADGQNLLAGGSSKFICLYDINQQQLVKKYQTSHNQSFDGMKVISNKKDITKTNILQIHK